MEDFNKPFYHEIEDFNYNKCYLKVRAFQPNESDFCGYINITERNDGSEISPPLCFKPVGPNVSDNGWVYSDGESIFMGVFSTLQAIFGVILNVLVFYVFLKTPSFRKEYLTPFVLSLATTDLIYSSITLPIIAIRYFMRGSPFEDYICSIFPLLYYGLHLCTMWNLVAITTVRCLGVYYPKKMRHDKFRRKTYLLIFLAWFFAYLPFLVTMSGLHNRHGFTCYQRKCSVLNLYDFELEKPQINVRMKTGVFTTAICLLLLVVLNGLIYRKLYYHSQKILHELKSTLSEKQIKKEVLKEKQFGKTMAVITCLFFITYCPVAALKSHFPDAAITHTTMTVIFTMIASSSVLTDPLIYIIRHEKYRRQMMRMLTPKSWNDSYKFDAKFTEIDTIESIRENRKLSVPNSMRKLSAVSTKSIKS